MEKTRNILMLIACTLMACGSLMACGNLIENECDPEFDDDCVCTLDDDPSIDVTDDCIDGETEDQEFCTCLGEFEDDFDDDNADNGNGNDNDNDNDNDEPAFRFVMVEDLTVNRGGEFPGADVDAVSLTKSTGGEIFASSFSAETDVDCADNSACDPSALLGPPDAVLGGNCFNGRLGDVDSSTFTALNGGLAVVQFSQNSNDVTIENGDTIRVYEIGATQCNGSFDDDPYRVAVSVSDDLGSFIEVGTGGAGIVTIPVSGL